MTMILSPTTECVALLSGSHILQDILLLCVYHWCNPTLKITQCHEQLNRMLSICDKNLSKSARNVIQVAQLWQGDRASSAILRGWVILRLNFRLMGYLLRQCLWTVSWMVVLQLCRWKFIHKETLLQTLFD